MPDKPRLPTPWGGRELDPFRGFRTQLDSLFEDWFGRSMGGTLAPRVDVSETAKEVTLKVELPGVEEKDIDVSLSGNQLTIKGEKKSEQKDEDRKEGEDGRVFHRVERSFGAFQRTMTVPFDVEASTRWRPTSRTACSPSRCPSRRAPASSPRRTASR